MFDTSVPVFIHYLKSLSAILRKAEDYCAAKKIDPAVMLSQRLYPHMFPLTRQVQIATDMAKGCVSRLAGVEIPVYEDKEATFGELIARVEKCIAYLESFSPGQVDGTEDKTIVLKRPTGDVSYPGLQYLLEYVTPNVYFHCAAAYSILRHCGVNIGKKDFIGPL